MSFIPLSKVPLQPCHCSPSALYTHRHIIHPLALSLLFIHSMHTFDTSSTALICCRAADACSLDLVQVDRQHIAHEHSSPGQHNKAPSLSCKCTTASRALRAQPSCLAATAAIGAAGRARCPARHAAAAVDCRCEAAGLVLPWRDIQAGIEAEEAKGLEHKPCRLNWHHREVLGAHDVPAAASTVGRPEAPTGERCEG